ncbi:MAG: T6SS effector BTH_I2691 family protein [Iodobacter sp.]
MADKQCTRTCEYCDKRGVAILPLRYAVVLPEAGAPQPVSLPEIVLDKNAAQYTARLLRSGYLYVFDEARKRWDDYFITPDGYYFKIKTLPGQPVVLPEKPFNCMGEGHRDIASCITIPNAKSTTKVWLAFSDAQWSDAVRLRHNKESYRKQHMRCVDVKAFAASADAKHCFSIKEAGNKIAEYALNKTALKKAAGFSEFTANERFGQDKSLLNKCESLYPGKGFAVVLDDSVGIAAELGALMNYHLHNFASDKDRARKLYTAGTIASLEVAVKEQARSSEEAAAKELANQQLAQPDIGMFFSDYAKNKIKRAEEIATVTEEEAKRAEKLGWEKYRIKFKETEMKAWQTQHDTELKKFDKKYIAPLAIAHAEWMKSTIIRHYFECNYDDCSMESGLVYARAVTLCIRSTQDKGSRAKLIADWLDGQIGDKHNFIMNALVLNDKKTKEEIKKAMAVSLDWRGFPLDPIAGAFGKAIENVRGGEVDVLGQLTTACAGGLTKLLNNALDGIVRPAMVAIGLHTQQTFVVVTVTGNKKEFRSLLIRDLIRLSGKSVGNNKLQQAVALQMRRLQLAGVPMTGQVAKRFLLLIDPSQIRNMPANLNSAAQAKWLAGMIKTPEQLEALNLAGWRSRLSNSRIGHATQGAVARIPLIACIIGGILQFNAMQKLNEDEGKAMSHEAQEALYRLGSGITAVVGTLVDLTALALEKVAHRAPLRLGQGLNRLINFGKWLGKAAGMVAGMVMAGWDAYQGVNAIQEKNHGLAALYFTSAGLGAAATYLLVYSTWALATGVGLLLVLGLILITLAIEYLKDNKFQEWLERCTWGIKGKEERYKTMEEEIKQFDMTKA